MPVKFISCQGNKPLPFIKSCFHRYPPLSAKLRPLIEDYVLSLQGRDDLIGESLLTATHETEKALLEKLKKGEEPDKGEESEEVKL